MPFLGVVQLLQSNKIVIVQVDKAQTIVAIKELDKKLIGCIYTHIKYLLIF